MGKYTDTILIKLLRFYLDITKIGQKCNNLKVYFSLSRLYLEKNNTFYLKEDKINVVFSNTVTFIRQYLWSSKTWCLTLKIRENYT